VRRVVLSRQLLAQSLASDRLLQTAPEGEPGVPTVIVFIEELNLAHVRAEERRQLRESLRVRPVELVLNQLRYVLLRVLRSGNEGPVRSFTCSHVSF
jgi:hypothetical protein